MAWLKAGMLGTSSRQYNGVKTQVFLASEGRRAGVQASARPISREPPAVSTQLLLNQNKYVLD
ncbi:hypothetical protein M407DRAFT_245770 [Tulasnella calospora MUT 4182]|uniref:Uncharacterized protein n=1 Tax=Tulasnella calospora MUT 4182 TaxID=1051891 RepID=A0A0C3Q8C9_9AGAM|nr:hypothetical protein M407DRAFT_245770 [Tulasnella calospora MUT 4182]